MKNLILSISFLTVLICNNLHAQQEFPVLKGPYLGQTPPGMTPEIFAPGFVSTHESEGSCTFFEDGNALLISRWIPFENENGEKQFRTVTYITTNKDGKWSEPIQTNSMGDFTPSPDGKKVFVSARKPDGMIMNKEFSENFRGGIGSVKLQNKMLSDIEFIPPPINMGSDGYPSITKEGHLYFHSSDRNGFGQRDVYVSEFVGGKYTEPKNLGKPVNSEQSEVDPFISPDGSFLIVCLQREDLFCYGERDLYISFNKEDGSWSVPINMGPDINSEAVEICPNISNDGKYFFFVSDRKAPQELIDDTKAGETDLYWVDAKVIEDLKPEHLK